MQIVNSYRFRIYPTEEQEKILFRTIGCARKTYNLILSRYQSLYALLKNKEIDECEYKKEIKALNPSKFKDEYPYLSEVDSTALKYAQKHCQQAYQNFFKGKANFPKFKKKVSSRWSYTTCRASKTATNLRLVKGGKLKLPKVPGLVTIVIHKNPKGVLVSATVHKARSGKWFVSLSFTQHIAPVKTSPAVLLNPVGIDMGIIDIVTLSNGTSLVNMKYAYHEKKALAALDKKLARQRLRAKKEGVKLCDLQNYQKTKVKRARLHEKVSNRREDYLHKLSSHIVKTHDFIALETLSSRNLLKNHKLSYAISDSAWQKLSSFLECKCKRSGSILYYVDRFYASTQICSHCGEHSGPSGLMGLDTRGWRCPICQSFHSRDINAARNILIKGISDYMSCTIGTMGEEDKKHLLSLVNTGSLELSSQEKFADQKL